MRFRGGLFALTGLLLVFVWPARDAGRPLTLHGPKLQAKESTAFLWRDDGLRLTRVDAHTLTRVGPLGPRLGVALDAWALARPSGNLVAVATHRYANETEDLVR